MRPVIFKPKKQVKRVVSGKTVVAFSANSFYNGLQDDAGRVSFKNSKYNKTWTLKSSEVKIIQYLDLKVPKNTLGR